MRASTAHMACIIALSIIASPAISGCSGDAETVVLVNVDAPANMPASDILEVTGTHQAESFTHVFDIDGEAFPLSFSITPTGREGDLVIQVAALDSAGETPVVLGQASGMVTIEVDQLVELDLVLAPAN